MSMDYDAFDRLALSIERLDAARRGEILSAYLDDELSPESARHVTAWLDAHPEHLREVEHDRRVWDLLELYADEPVPEGFAGSVLAQVGVAPSPRGRFFVLRPVAAAAAAALLVAAGALLFAVVGDRSAPTGGEAVTESAVVTVPVEYLEEVDALLALSDEQFQGYLLADLDVSLEDG